MLKRIILALLIFCSFGSLFANAEEVLRDPKEVLELIKNDVSITLIRLDFSEREVAKEIEKSGITSAQTKTALAQFYTSMPFLTDCSILDKKGVVVVVEPLSAGKLKGVNFGNQEQVKELYKNKKPVLSKMFLAVEKINGITLQYPILSADGKLQGAISAFFEPRTIFAPLEEAFTKEGSFEIWVIDDSGTVIYDNDAEEIGKNIFKDDFYKPYPGLVNFAKNVVSTETGEGSYEFLAKGLSKPVKKEALWTTVGMHGKKWHIVLALSKINEKK